MADKFYIAVTAIIKCNGRVLIVKRHPNEKRWPNKWTVPGGRLEITDFIGTPTKINNQWYHTLENAVRREVKEEVNLEIENIKFLCDIAIPDTVIVSFTADLVGNDIPYLKEDEMTEYCWVSNKYLEDYDMIDGIADEIRLALTGEQHERGTRSA